MKLTEEQAKGLVKVQKIISATEGGCFQGETLNIIENYKKLTLTNSALQDVEETLEFFYGLNLETLADNIHEIK